MGGPRDFSGRHATRMAESRADVELSQTPTSTAGAASSALCGQLGRLRLAARWLLLGQRLAAILAATLAGLIALALIDFVLRSPGWVRGALLGGAVAVVAWMFWRRVFLVLRFRPALSEFALRLEGLDQDGAAGARGVLASGVQFAQDQAVGGLGRGPAHPLVTRALESLQKLGGWRVLKPGATLAALGALAGVLLVVASLFAAQPRLAQTGASRVLAPWSDAQWPKRTDIEDATLAEFHPLGAALPLRAVLLSSTRAADETRVEAVYRLIDAAGQTGPERRLLLTSQDRTMAVPGIEDATGTLFERLLEPTVLVEAGSSAGAAVPAAIEYSLVSSDDETPKRRVTLVQPPRVVAARATVTPPAYVPVVLDAAGKVSPAAPVELGAGTDERAALPGVLVGSRVTLSITLNKNVPPPALDPSARRAWLAGALGEQFASLVADKPAANLSMAVAGAEWALAWTVRDSVRLPVRPTDSFGLGPDAEATFRVEARTDRPPEASVLKPSDDGEVLPSAVVEVVAEGRDDLALVGVRAEFQMARRVGGSESGAIEPAADWTSAADAALEQPGQRTLRATARIDLDQLKAKPGEELWLSALATDAYELDGARHAAVRSTVRKIRIISTDQLVEQVWQDLGSLRRSAIRLSEQQAALHDSVRAGRDPGATARDQAGVSESAARQEQSVERLRERLARNNLGEHELSRVLDDAKALLQQTRAASENAGRDLREAQQAAAREDEPAQAKSRESAERAQEDAQKSLEQLAQLLDRGQDTWSARRALERLIADQKAVRDESAQAGRETTGKQVSELTPAEQQKIAEIGDKQEELSRKADEAIRDLQQRAEKLKATDPETAAAMREAAQRGQRQQVPEELQKAAKDVRENKQQSANQRQDKAVKELQQILEQMEKSSRGRDEVLKRELQSLIESLDALIARQQNELALLVGVEPQGLAAVLGAALDGAMIQLRTNTLAVAEQARAAGRQTKAIAELVTEAADAQAAAIVALRAEPLDLATAKASEERSLERLLSAKEKAAEAQKQAQERSVRAQRADLRRAYRELLDQQTDLRVRAREAAAMEAGRRQRAAARELFEGQDGVRKRASELAANTPEIGESVMFKFAHERLDEAVSAAAAGLGEGEATPQVIARQSTAIRVLSGILEAFADAQQAQDEFREAPEGQEQQQGGGGGGQAQKLIPPAAELKNLRQTQAEALTLTREASEATDAAVAQASAAEAGKLQSALVEKAKQILENLMKQQQNAPKTAPAGGAG